MGPETLTLEHEQEASLEEQQRVGFEREHDAITAEVTQEAGREQSVVDAEKVQEAEREPSVADTQNSEGRIDFTHADGTTRSASAGEIPPECPVFKNMSQEKAAMMMRLYSRGLQVQKDKTMSAKTEKVAPETVEQKQQIVKERAVADVEKKRVIEQPIAVIREAAAVLAEKAERFIYKQEVERPAQHVEPLEPKQAEAPPAKAAKKSEDGRAAAVQSKLTGMFSRITPKSSEAAATSSSKDEPVPPPVVRVKTMPEQLLQVPAALAEDAPKKITLAAESTELPRDEIVPLESAVKAPKNSSEAPKAEPVMLEQFDPEANIQIAPTPRAETFEQNIDLPIPLEMQSTFEDIQDLPETVDAPAPLRMPDTADAFFATAQYEDVDNEVFTPEPIGELPVTTENIERAELIVGDVRESTRLTREHSEQVETLVTTLPDRVQTSLLRVIQNPEYTKQVVEKKQEIESQIVMIASVANKLHDLAKAGLDETHEALEIVVMLEGQYRQLCNKIGAPVDENSVKQFIKTIVSDDYQYQTILAAKSGFDPMRERQFRTDLQRGRTSSTRLGDLFGGLAQVMVRLTTSIS